MKTGRPTLVATFAQRDHLIGAVRGLDQARAEPVDAFGPEPMEDIAHALGRKTSVLPWVGLAAVLVGGALQYFAQYWLNAVDYPLNVGGRPLHSWPAFIPATIIVSFLWGSVAVFAGFLVGCSLPRLHHPVFDLPGFERASQDRYLLLVEARPDRVRETVTLLESHGATVEETSWPR